MFPMVEIFCFKMPGFFVTDKTRLEGTVNKLRDNALYCVNLLFISLLILRMMGQSCSDAVSCRRLEILAVMVDHMVRREPEL